MTLKESPSREWFLTSLERFPTQQFIQAEQFKKLTTRMSWNNVQKLLNDQKIKAQFL